MNRETGEQLDDEVEHIKQSIKDILLTAKGSRVMRRTYGSNLDRLIDKPIAAVLFMQLSAACVMALQQWEHRITITRFKVEFAQDNQSRLICTLDFTIKKRKISIKGMSLKL
ncbi:MULTISPECIES: GPW/gp25 family protein [Mannheimia]|uniref:GPW/gp25 family protein n=1 Tax=Mannheimia TaxID=75984 RepID=UPI00159F4B5F|nr:MULTISPECIES: GPW/gp25 family protein [Mannheimia]QLB44704.1 GPW/gp25 family protein [Mannheimia pernigra]QTM01901.1 baseplate wedge subunit [Mannheimia sp. ZY171111]